MGSSPENPDASPVESCGVGARRVPYTGVENQAQRATIDTRVDVSIGVDGVSKRVAQRRR
jgi:hypothetical protein